MEIMKGTEKQVKWAKELRQQILESEEVLFKCYEKQLDQSSIKDYEEVDFDELIEIWCNIVRVELANQDARFYIDNFKEGTDPNQVHLFIWKNFRDEFPDYASHDLYHSYDQIHNIATKN